MASQTPRDLETVTVLEFIDGGSHFLQSWKGQLYFEAGDVINLRGDLGTSDCKPGRYVVNTSDSHNVSQLDWNQDGTDVFKRFYKCVKKGNF